MCVTHKFSFFLMLRKRRSCVSEQEATALPTAVESFTLLKGFSTISKNKLNRDFQQEIGLEFSAVRELLSNK